MDRKQEILERQQELLDAAKREGRDLPAGELEEFNRLQREFESLSIQETQQEDAASRQEPEQRGADNGQGLYQREAASPQNVQAETAGAVDNPGENAAERAVRQAIARERKRTAEITALCRSFGIDPSEHIASGAEMDQVRAAVITQLQRERGPVSVSVTGDEGDKFRDAASDALMLRSGIQPQKQAAGAQEFRSMHLKDLAVECLSREGRDIRTLMRMAPSDLFNELCRQFYNPSAAFPAILDSTIRKSIVVLYNSVPTTFQAWVTKGSLSDFKETSDHEYVIGGLGDFEEVPENGEIKADVPQTRLLPHRKLKTYAKQFSMTRQAFINDDIGFLTRVPGLYATKAKQTLDKQVYMVLYENRKIFDEEPLFGKKHANLMEHGGKPSQALLQEMILRMQRQKDSFGDAIYVRPKYIIVPVGYEFDLAVIFHSAQVTGSANNDINPLYNYPMQTIQTPVLNALAGDGPVPWYMVADPMSAKSLHVDYLDGQETPVVRRMEAPGVLGYTWDIYTDWGISVRDFRGIVKNPGEVIK